MKIILVQKEIEEAIKSYIGKTVILNGRKLDVDLTAGRGTSGFSAEVSVTTIGEPTAIPPGPIARKPDVGSVESTPKPARENAVDPEVKKIEPDDNASLFGGKKDAKAAS